MNDGQIAPLVMLSKLRKKRPRTTHPRWVHSAPDALGAACKLSKIELTQRGATWDDVSKKCTLGPKALVTPTGESTVNESLTRRNGSEYCPSFGICTLDYLAINGPRKDKR